MKLRHILAMGAVTAATALPARAQFTTAVYPPKTRPPAAVVKARADSARRTDSASVARRMHDMKEWVDSVALVLAERPTANVASADTAVTATESKGEVAAPTKERGRSTTSFRNGAPAPATATDVPTFALLGLGALVAGALLRRR